MGLDGIKFSPYLCIVKIFTETELHRSVIRTYLQHFNLHRSMKKSLLFMSMALTGLAMSAAGTTADSNSLPIATTPTTVSTANVPTAVAPEVQDIDLLEKLEGIVVEQSITFLDGTKAVVYYRVEDGCVAVYSQTDLSKYSLNDLINVKDSSERRVEAVKGKRQGKYSVSAIRKIVLKLLKA